MGPYQCRQERIYEPGEREALAQVGINVTEIDRVVDKTVYKKFKW
jgi:hypothetical protein